MQPRAIIAVVEKSIDCIRRVSVRAETYQSWWSDKSIANGSDLRFAALAMSALVVCFGHVVTLEWIMSSLWIFLR